MKQNAASGYSDEEGKKSVRKESTTGCGETALTDQQESIKFYCNESMQQIYPQNPLTFVTYSET